MDGIFPFDFFWTSTRSSHFMQWLRNKDRKHTVQLLKMVEPLQVPLMMFRHGATAVCFGGPEMVHCQNSPEAEVPPNPVVKYEK